jgi:hypothetical protein
MKKELEGLRDLVVQTREDERAREGSVRKMYDEEDMAMYRDGLKPAFGMPEVKKRRGVRILTRGRFGFSSTNGAPSSAQLHQVVVIAAIGSIRPNGEGAQTEHAHFATPAAYTTPSWRGNARPSSGRSDLNRATS